MGSEMCIRDRPTITLPLNNTTDNATLHVPQGTQRSHCQVKTGTEVYYRLVLFSFLASMFVVFFIKKLQRSCQSTSMAFIWCRLSLVCCLALLLYPTASSSFPKTLQCGHSCSSLFLVWASGSSFLFSDVGRLLLWWFTCILTLCTGGSSKIPSSV